MSEHDSNCATRNFKEVPGVDYSLFCDQHSSRIKEPFIIGGYLYCTNGSIAIRIPMPDELDSVGKFPTSIVRLFDEMKFENGNPCPEVKGPPSGFDKFWTKHQIVDCDHCAGSGNCECECGHEHDCQACEGLGEYNDEVHADARLEPVPIYGRTYQRQNIWRISQLPNAEVCPYSVNNDGPLPFKFEGGVGCLMPLNT